MPIIILLEAYCFSSLFHELILPSDMDFETMENILYKDVPPKLNTLAENIAQGNSSQVFCRDNLQLLSEYFLTLNKSYYQIKTIKLQNSKSSEFRNSKIP